MLGKLFVVLCMIALVSGDIYMHNPRGSNCRLNGQGTNRNNGNRLFDTQNNAKGGYTIAPFMHFYSGSLLEIEWTNQHGCGNGKVKCEVVIQYMCGDDIRDGTTSNTIPDDENEHRQTTTITDDEDLQFYRANGEDENEVYVYGMHESYEYYQLCKQRSRNRGLFIADRNVGNSARSTRQNNGGTRRGFECPEERDYYPYWHPSPWIDIAVLTDDTTRCPYYRSKSGNVLGKNYCTVTSENNEASCQIAAGEWLRSDDNDGGKPECESTPFSRVNHLGNGKDGKNNKYKWIIPSWVHHEHCVLRIRYNMTSSDVKWDTDHTNNEENSPIYQDQRFLWRQVDNLNQSVEIALDTSQNSRTFQDRSHTFAIRKVTGSDKDKRIYNLNVRGKRGNIVQTYPAVEYDFVPNKVEAVVGDKIHLQWTGSRYNPQNNDGEGTAPLDLHNLIEMKDNDLASTKPGLYGDGNFFSSDQSITLALQEQYDNEDPATRCLTYDELAAKHNNNNGNIQADRQNCFKMNSAPFYRNMGRITVDHTGTWHFLCTRNNNFSNRSQKGTIDSDPFLPVWAVVLVVLAGVVCMGAVAVSAVGFTARLLPDTKLGQGWQKINFIKQASDADAAAD